MRPERVGVRPGKVAAELMSGGSGGGASSRPPSPWRTPTPYLFLGFAVMMGLIVVALLVLICTRRRAAAAAGGGTGKAESVRGVLVPLDREEPKFVVIMAGDSLPSFLASAKPLSFLPAPATEAHGAAV